MSKPRVQAARQELGRHPDLTEVVAAYKSWVNYPEYLVFQGISKYGYFDGPWTIKNRDYYLDQKKWVKKESVIPVAYKPESVKYTAALAAKRGNRVYRGRLSSRLKILDKGRELALSVFARGKALKFTSYIFTTLTYARDDRLGDIWENVGSDYNRWITGIRKKFGKCEVVRCFESHEDGYPHIHVLLIFHDYDFTVFRHKNKWRIHKKKEFEWSWGWVDVQAIKEIGEAFRYITKYIRKAPELAGWKAQLTMALTWFYGKRAWSCSRSINDLIRALRNSNQKGGNLPIVELRAQYTWYLLGFWGGGELPPWERMQVEFDEYGGWGPPPGLDLLPGELKLETFRGVYCSEGWTDFKYRRAPDTFNEF